MYAFITQYEVDFKVIKHHPAFIKAKYSMKLAFQAAPKRLSHSGQSVIGLYNTTVWQVTHCIRNCS